MHNGATEDATTACNDDDTRIPLCTKRTLFPDEYKKNQCWTLVNTQIIGCGGLKCATSNRLKKVI